MAQNKTVLTVSYGTFSCTLEGFDDSFGMMKSIAEYFRELAAEDRFFGAEPPAPDAELLSRMASANARTPVSARHEDGRLILSPNGDNAPQGEDGNLFVETSKAPQTKKPASNISDRLARIRAVVGNEAAHANAAFTEDEHATEEFFAKDVPASEAEEEYVEDTHSTDQTEQSAQDETAQDHAPAIETQENKSVVEASADLDDALSTAAKSADAEMLEQAEDSAQEHPDEVVEAQSTADDLPDSAQIDEEVKEEGADQAADQTSDTSQDEVEPEAAPEVTDEALPEAPQVKREGRRHVIRIQPQREPKQEAPTQDTTIEEHADANPIVEEQAVPSADPVAELNETQQDDLMKALADIDAELEAMDDENADDSFADADTFDLNLENIAPRADTAYRQEVDDLAQDDIAQEQEEDRSVTEAPLVLENAIEDTTDVVEPAQTAESDAEPEEAEDTSEAPIQLRRPVARGARPARPSSETPRAHPQTDEQSVERLLDETDVQMAKPENSRRRSALAHLRAAVAATMADKLAGGDKAAKEEKAETENAFREDLAEQVKPARPAQRKLNEAVRENNSQPSAPLRLVAEQRIDAEPSPAAAPQMDTTQYDSFEDFAAAFGAVELRDRLEAAAAYISFVEGHEKFSRPQLMNKVRQIESDDFNREDGLRSFGQLLREGKIEKLDGGRFTAAQNIGFHPERKTANG